MRERLVRIYQTLSLDDYIMKRELLTDAGVNYREKISSGDSNIDYLAKLFVYNQPATGVRVERQQIYSLYVTKKEKERKDHILRGIIQV